jgi:hypothetical protein
MSGLLHLLAWAWRAVPTGPDLLLIALGLLLLAVLLPMIERGEALPRRGRSAGAGARSSAGGPAGV